MLRHLPVVTPVRTTVSEACRCDRRARHVGVWQLFDVGMSARLFVYRACLTRT
jgi:hypothetical protein